jgi:hypothetical protein
MRAIRVLEQCRPLKPCTRGKTCRTPFDAEDTNVLFTSGFGSQFPENGFQVLHDAQVKFAGIVGPAPPASRSQNVSTEAVAVEVTHFRPWPRHKHVN